MYLYMGSVPSLFTAFSWISLIVTNASPVQEKQEDPSYSYDALQSATDSTAFYKFPNPYCKHVGQFLPHPTNKCFYLRCDYGTEPWMAKRGESLPLFTIEQSCPPGTSVNRTTFYYVRYLQEEGVKPDDPDFDLDPNDPYNFPASPCTIVDPDCALVIPATEQQIAPGPKPSRQLHQPPYKEIIQARRHQPRPPITDENGFIRPEDLPDAPGNPYH